MAKAGSEKGVCNPGPGSLGQRVNYGLHENVVVVDLPENVRAKCQEVRRDQADVLGLQGPKWQASTVYCSHKFQQKASDTRLSNTLRPDHIPSADFRRTAGTTHTPTRRQVSPALERSLPCSQPQNGAMWHASTEVARRDILQGAEEVTQLSMQATQRCRHTLLSNGKTRYVSPEQRVAAQQAARIAALQDSEAARFQQLEALYGHEGALAMQAIMQMPQYGKKSMHRAGKASKDELSAVLQLPDEVSGSRGSTPAVALQETAVQLPAEASKQSMASECMVASDADVNADAGSSMVA